VEIEAEGYLARALQHENDHLNGVLFTDRLSPLRRQFLRRSLDGLARGEVPEGYHPGEPGHGGAI
jgi:peptide deformylase